MSNLVEWVGFIVPIISISFIFMLTSINMYMKIRKRFPIRVNCWFCNIDASVPYSQFNSWTCVHCEQYNGFDKNGDYNCEIPAQRSIQLNQRWKTIGDNNNGKSPSFVASTSALQKNRLCENCNRNQEIKVQQLASFEPVIEENFDIEIENFREKLEKSYQLCYTCQRFVKRSLNRITNNVLGLRLSQIGKKGLQVIDRHVKGADSAKGLVFHRICLMTLTILAILNLFNSCKDVRLSRNHLDAFFPPAAKHFVLTVISIISAAKLLVVEYSSTIFSPAIYMAEKYFDPFKYAVDKDYQIDFGINLAAVLLSLKLMLTNCSSRLCSFLLIFLWNVNMLWPTIAERVVDEFAGILLKIFVGVTIVVMVSVLHYTSFATDKCPPTNNSFHRIYSNCDEDLSDNSDEGEVTYSSASTPSKNDYDISHLNHSISTTKSINSDVSRSASYARSFQDLNSSSRSGNEYWNQTYNHNLSKRSLNADQLYPTPFRIPDECQNKLTDLNISGMGRRNDYTLTCPSPTPSIFINDRSRSQLLTPARLNFNGHPMNASATKTSWVAGGFFVKNKLSPQKRQQSQRAFLHPISRTSSQSSGFESRASSAHNGYDSGSRESSIAGDDGSLAGDVISNFSEPPASSPTLLSSSPLNFNFPSNRRASLITKNQMDFMNYSTSCRPESVNEFYMIPVKNCAYDNKVTLLPDASMPVYHQFGTHRFGDNMCNKFPYRFRDTCKESIVKHD